MLIPVLLSVALIWLGVWTAGGRTFEKNTGITAHWDYSKTFSTAWAADLQCLAIIDDDGSPLYTEDDLQPFNFYESLALFFPSVTGIMAGSNRSGDLRNAQQSIPLGTLAAVLVTSSIYLLTVLFYGGVGEREDEYGRAFGLKTNYLLSADVSLQDTMTRIGIVMSCLGAALQSLTGAPRLLQAIANDNLMPVLRTFQGTGEPRKPLLLTFIICMMCVATGNIDTVAPLITMFFLMCYSAVNLCVLLMSFMREPNWRPRFKYYHPMSARPALAASNRPWLQSLRRCTRAPLPPHLPSSSPLCTSSPLCLILTLTARAPPAAAAGFCLCVFIMFSTNTLIAAAACLVVAAIYKYIEFQKVKVQWGDGTRGLRYQRARQSLLALEKLTTVHVKNWRPQACGRVKACSGVTVRDGVTVRVQNWRPQSPFDLTFDLTLDLSTRCAASPPPPPPPPPHSIPHSISCPPHPTSSPSPPTSSPPPPHRHLLAPTTSSSHGPRCCSSPRFRPTARCTSPASSASSASSRELMESRSSQRPSREISSPRRAQTPNKPDPNRYPHPQ